MLHSMIEGISDATRGFTEKRNIAAHEANLTFNPPLPIPSYLVPCRPTISLRRIGMALLSTLLMGATALMMLSVSAQAQVMLKTSHQFPGGTGDARDEMVQIIAREVKAANVGVDVQV